MTSLGSPADWDWDRILGVSNALFTMVAGVAAAIAVWMTSSEAKAARKARAEDARQALYSRVVLDPLLSALERLAEEGSALLAAEHKRIRDLDPSLLPHDQMIRECGLATSRFNELFFKTKGAVRRSMIAWKDDQLERQVTKLLEDLQDAVTKILEREIGTSPPTAPTLLSSFSDALGFVQQELVDYQTRGTSSKALVRNQRRGT